MVEVNEKLTLRVAELAQLKLSAGEVTEFTRQLGDILNYVEQLQKIDVSGVEPLTQAVLFETKYREDIAKPGLLTKDGLPKSLGSVPEVMPGGMPEDNEDGFKVPPIL